MNKLMNPEIRMIWESTPDDVEFEGTLLNLAEINDMEPEETAEILSGLHDRGEYIGGGGAAPIYIIRYR